MLTSLRYFSDQEKEHPPMGSVEATRRQKFKEVFWRIGHSLTRPIEWIVDHTPDSVLLYRQSLAIKYANREQKAPLIHNGHVILVVANNIFKRQEEKSLKTSGQIKEAGKSLLGLVDATRDWQSVMTYIGGTRLRTALFPNPRHLIYDELRIRELKARTDHKSEQLVGQVLDLANKEKLIVDAGVNLTKAADAMKAQMRSLVKYIEAHGDADETYSLRLIKYSFDRPKRSARFTELVRKWSEAQKEKKKKAEQRDPQYVIRQRLLPYQPNLFRL